MDIFLAIIFLLSINFPTSFSALALFLSKKFSDCDFKLDVETVYQVVQRKKISAFIIPLKNRGTLDGLQTLLANMVPRLKMESRV